MVSRFIRSGVAASYPLLFGAACILDRFANINADESELLRPLFVTVLFAALLFLVSFALLRHVAWASLIASIAVLLFLSFPVPLGVVGAIAIWWILVGFLNRRQQAAITRLHPTDPPMRIVAAFCLALFALNAWTIGQTLTGRGAHQDPLAPPSTPGGPDIYLLLLDGYPRGDTIRELGFDNASFEDRLARLGFAVASEARSNYTKTWLTVSSLLSGRYTHELPALSDPPASARAQVRLLHDVINDAPVLDYFRQRGYEIVSIPSPTMRGDVTRGVRVERVSNLSGFEVALVSSTLAAIVAPDATLDFLAGDAREFSHRQLAEWSGAGPEAAQPRLILSHLMSPHPPFVMGQKADYLLHCFPSCSVWATTAVNMGLSADEYAHRMEVQLTVLNEMVAGAAERIVASDPGAVIIVMSDHGARYSLEAIEEHFHILFAARTPEHDDVFPNDVSPVNVFRRLLSTYFGEDLPDLGYRAWLSDWDIPLTLARRE